MDEIPGRNESVEPTIRAAEAGDSSALADLIRTMGYAVTADAVRQRLAALPPADAVFVAVVRGCVVGWVHVVHSHSLIAGPRVELAGLAVSQRHQGAGLGGMLLRHAEQWAAQRGLAVVHLRSGMERDAAHRFYESHGYQRVKAQYAFTRNLTDG